MLRLRTKINKATVTGSREKCKRGKYSELMDCYVNWVFYRLQELHLLLYDTKIMSLTITWLGKIMLMTAI